MAHNEPKTTSLNATRAETIADYLRQAVRAGEYVSGERLVELTLAQKFNVSQNTVRDALRILEGEGWVVKHARRGVYVRAYTSNEAEELYSLWATLEGLALQWTVDAITKADLARLRQMVAQAQTQFERGDTRGCTDLLFAFHKAVGRISGKTQTAALLTMLHNQVRLLETLRHMRTPRNLPQQNAHIAAYERLLAALEAGDVDASQSCMSALIMADCETLLPLLAAARF